jgi:hypothetical protein
MTALRVSRQLTGPAGKFCFKLATLPGRVVGQRRQQCPSALRLADRRKADSAVAQCRSGQGTRFVPAAQFEILHLKKGIPWRHS